MLSLTCTRAGTNSDYLKYLAAGITKTDRRGDSTLLDFTLYGKHDNSFVKLVRGDYIIVDSIKYPKWFTGVIINDPELEYLGPKNGQPQWGYRYQATSEDYILNVKPVGFSKVFLNRTAGSIIKELITRLNPGFFDVAGVDEGPFISQLVLEPDKRFIEVVRTLSEGTLYTFYCNDKKCYFKPQDNTSFVVTVDKNDKHTTPSRLTLKPVSSGSGVINDVVVVGDIEPQNYVSEYFIGTGFDAAFNLIGGVYGADSIVYLDETFTSSTIPAQWTVVDNPSTPYLKTLNGYLNCIGGEAGLQVFIRSTDPLPIEGNMRLTHGEFDFVSSGVGVICGIWKNPPSAGYSGCMYGLDVNGFVLSPVVNGTIDTSQTFTVSNTKRYVIRTLLSTQSLNRSAQQFNYLNASGTLENKTSSNDPAVVTLVTRIVEIEPTNGTITKTFDFVNSATFSVNDVYAYYVPLASTDLHCTVTNITISIPLNASLSFADKPGIVNSSFDEWDDVNQPTGWENVVNYEQVSSDVNFAAKLNFADGNPAQASQNISELVRPNTTYTISARVKRGSASSGNFRIFLEYTDGLDVITIPCVNVLASTISTGQYDIVTGTVLIPADPVPFDLSITVSFTGSTNGSFLFVDDLIMIGKYEEQLIGPNEIDASDGLAPVATIIAATPTAENFNSYLGVPAFTKGQSQLVFFKDSINRTTTIPIKNQVVRLKYRDAGPAVGRSINRQSVYTEGLKWFDTGIRYKIVEDPFPRPRSSEECELYAAAVVAEESFDHYQGSYTQYSNYFTDHPRAGGVIKLLNFPDFGDKVEEISQVSTVCDAYGSEVFIHTIEFGKPEVARSVLSSISTVKTKRKTSTNIPKLNPVAYNSIGLIYAQDLPNVQVTGWDSKYVYIDIGETIGSDLYFEIRSSDYGWGATDSRNLITRTTSRTFTIERGLRGKAVFIRRVRRGNYLFYSEDITNAVYTKSGVTVTNLNIEDIEGGKGLIANAVFSGAASSISQSQLVTASGSTPVVFTCDIKGPLGKTIKLKINSTEQTYTMTGHWQRLSVNGTVTGVSSPVAAIEATEAYTVQTTKWSLEAGTPAETIYTKTESTQYGPTSRFTSVVNIVFPIDTTVTTGTTDLGLLRPGY